MNRREKLWTWNAWPLAASATLKWREKLLTWIAWRLPRELAYWCFIRVWAYGTVGKYGNTHPDDLTWSEASRRWHVPMNTTEPTPSAELEQQAGEIRTMRDLLDDAWVIIANAGGGDWTKEEIGWGLLASRWSTRFHAVKKEPF